MNQLILIFQSVFLSNLKRFLNEFIYDNGNDDLILIFFP